MLDLSTIERMRTASGQGPILVALSGGGDSVALMMLLRREFPELRVYAVVVDHKLRPGSAEDAVRAADIASWLGCRAYIEELSWLEGANRGHEAARSARYRAICDAAQKLGASVVATGHTRDDQAETVLMRAARGSGLRGLAGMRAWAPMPVWPEGRNMWLARPLLSARRLALRRELNAIGASWIEDPANADEKYARARVRALLELMDEDHGLDPMRLAELAERLRPIVDEIDKHAAALISDAAAFNEDEIVLDHARWRGDDAVRQRALEALIMAASGEDRGPTLAQLETLTATLDQPTFSGATLGGALLQARRSHLIIRRDPGALTGRADGAAPLPPFPLTAGEESVWDGRVVLMPREPGWSVVCDGSAPELQRGDERRPLAAASPHWLLKERIRHVLGAN